MHIITRWFGVFLVEAGEVKQKLLFPQNTDDVAARIMAIQDGQVLDEEREIAKLVEEKDAGPVFVGEKRLAAIGIFEPVNHYIAPEEHGFSPGLLHEAMLVVAKSGLAAPKRDRLLIQAMGAMDELNKTCNLISERLAEWYGHHSHDLAKNLSPKTLAEVVASFGTVEEIVQNTELEGHRSGDLEQQDMSPIRSLARLQLEVFKERERVEKYIHSLMDALAPNTKAVAGPVLGARLIADAGGLEKLAFLPASTVQVLGAETALFLHLKEGRKPPKHGHIFQHTLVHNAPVWQRGKIARSLAAKISTAARIDNASGRDLSKELLEQLEKRVVEIRKRHPYPPERKKDDSGPRGAGHIGQGQRGKQGKHGGGRR